jgi:hypothetical protein
LATKLNRLFRLYSMRRNANPSTIESTRQEFISHRARFSTDKQQGKGTQAESGKRRKSRIANSKQRPNKRMKALDKNREPG